MEMKLKAIMMNRLRNITSRGLLLLLALLMSQCAHDENSYEGLVDNFNEHEECFAELIAAFNSQLRHHDTENYQMELTVGEDRDSVFVGRTPYIINDESGERSVHLGLRKGTRIPQGPQRVRLGRGFREQDRGFVAPRELQDDSLGEL